MSALIALSWRAVSRTKWQQRLAPPPEQGRWPWIAAAAVALCAVSAVVVGLRFARLPADAFATKIDLRALPRLMQAVRVVMASSVAGFFEELGFRGVIQGSLARRYGAARSIGITAALFYVLHFGHSWMLGDFATVAAVAVPFLLGGVLLGALASLTGSLGPSMVAHALINMVLLPLEWTGSHRLGPISRTGLDAHLVWWTMTAGVSTVTCMALLRRLASTELHVDFSFKPSEPEDEAFLRQLNRLAYEEVVVAQFGSWDPVKQKAFFDAKWQAQSYSIVVAAGAPIGAFSSARSESAVTLLELLVLPEHQNRGVGTRVIQQLQQEARSQQVPLVLQVLHLNRARRLYERLGFRVFETTETHYRMRWESEPSS